MVSKEYSSKENLIKAFVNDGITSGHVYNLIVYGNTLYVDEGNDGRNLFFYQLVIRLSDNVFICNSRGKHETIDKYITNRIIEHMAATHIRIYLNTLNHKKRRGSISEKRISLALDPPSYVFQPSRIKTALKKYQRDQSQNNEIENLTRQLFVYNQFKENKYGDKKRIAIERIITDLAKAKEICAKIDQYLDIFTYEKDWEGRSCISFR